MGMLVEGTWRAETDRFMSDGAFRREASSLPSAPVTEMATALAAGAETLVLVASDSCPWSHATVLARAVTGLAARLPLQPAGGPRIEGYGLRPTGPIAQGGAMAHAHQLYTATDPQFTGRATVPILWDTAQERILSNRSADILLALAAAAPEAGLYPCPLRAEIDRMIAQNFDSLANAVYRAGLAERQTEYDAAVEAVFDRMHALERHLETRAYLVGDQLSLADLRLFACLVRFDTVYATHFRCTRHRLTDFPHLWRYTRALYQRPEIGATVDFDEIRRGYYLNDGAHNPHGILAAQPVIDWAAPVDPPDAG